MKSLPVAATAGQELALPGRTGSTPPHGRPHGGLPEEERAFGGAREEVCGSFRTLPAIAGSICMSVVVDGQKQNRTRLLGSARNSNW